MSILHSSLRGALCAGFLPLLAIPSLADVEVTRAGESGPFESGLSDINAAFAKIQADASASNTSYVVTTTDDGTPYPSFNLSRVNDTLPLSITIRPRKGEVVKTRILGVQSDVTGNGDGLFSVTLQGVEILGLGNSGGLRFEGAGGHLQNCVVRSIGLGTFGSPNAALEIVGTGLSGSAVVQVEDSVVKDCIRAFGSGGGGAAQISQGGRLEAARTLFKNNKADLGGAIQVDARQSFAGSCNDFAGEASEAILSRCRFVDNEATDAGGAVNADSYASLDIDHCYFGNNVMKSFGGLSQGGAVRAIVPVQMALTNSIFEGNTCENFGFGGALAIDGVNSGSQTACSQDVLLVANCLFVQNSARVGGVIYLTNSDVSFFGCTLADNTATNGGNTIVEGGSSNAVTFSESIIKTHGMPDGLSTALIFNSLQSAAPGFDIGTLPVTGRGEPFRHHQTEGEVNTKFVTPGYALEPGSPAIDAGAPNDCTTALTGTCWKTTQVSLAYDNNGARDLGYHYSAPAPLLHTPFSVDAGNESFAISLGETVDFEYQAGPHTVNHDPVFSRVGAIAYIGPNNPTPNVIGGPQSPLLPYQVMTRPVTAELPMGASASPLNGEVFSFLGVSVEAWNGAPTYVAGANGSGQVLIPNDVKFVITP